MKVMCIWVVYIKINCYVINIFVYIFKGIAADVTCQTDNKWIEEIEQELQQLRLDKRL